MCIRKFGLRVLSSYTKSMQELPAVPWIAARCSGVWPFCERKGGKYTNTSSGLASVHVTEVESETHNCDEVDDGVGFLGDQQLDHGRESVLTSQVERRPIVCLRSGCGWESDVCECMCAV